MYIRSPDDDISLTDDSDDEDDILNDMMPDTFTTFTLHRNNAEISSIPIQKARKHACSFEHVKDISIPTKDSVFLPSHVTSQRTDHADTDLE